MKISSFFLLALFLFIIGKHGLHAQETENELNEGAELFTEKSKLNPKKAVLYSAIVPGLGQIYNKQPWKLPFIYGGLFAVGYFINFNNEYFQETRNALSFLNAGNDQAMSPFPNLSSTALSTRVEQFRRDRDFLIIVGVGVYLLNIIDAQISAHLEEFAINDELQLSFEPSYNNTAFGTKNVGIALVLRFK